MQTHTLVYLPICIILVPAINATCTQAIQHIQDIQYLQCISNHVNTDQYLPHVFMHTMHAIQIIVTIQTERDQYTQMHALWTLHSSAYYTKHTY